MNSFPDKSVSRRCLFCTGEYVRKDAISTVRRLGSTGYGLDLGGAGDITWHVFECSSCGNVQLFRKEVASS